MLTTSRATAGNRGYLQVDVDALRAAIIAAHRAGWQVATHAIGDRAIATVLDIYATRSRAYPRPDPATASSTAAWSGPRTVAPGRGARRDPVPQGRFVSEIGDGMLAALGPERTPGATGSGPCSRPACCCRAARTGRWWQGAPLLGIHDMVNQRTASGAPFNPAEAVTAEQALRAWTWGSAYASRQEHVKGSIAPGKLADLVVLSEDPTAVSPDRIAGLEVLATITGGQPRYNAGAFADLS